jgi:trigger factor
MSARLEKIEKSEAHLNFEVDAQTFEEGLQKAYKKVVKQVAIPVSVKAEYPGNCWKHILAAKSF